MKQVPKAYVLGKRWQEFAHQLPLELTSDGKVIAKLYPKDAELIDITNFPVLIKREILSRVEMVKNAGLG